MLLFSCRVQLLPSLGMTVVMMILGIMIATVMAMMVMVITMMITWITMIAKCFRSALMMLRRMQIGRKAEAWWAQVVATIRKLMKVMMIVVMMVAMMVVVMVVHMMMVMAMMMMMMVLMMMMAMAMMMITMMMTMMRTMTALTMNELTLVLLRGHMSQQQQQQLSVA